MQCTAHPQVETELRCGKCETPICPRCLVQTPVGARCKPCANLRKPVIYSVPPLILLRGVGMAVAVAIAIGLLWGYLLPHAATSFGFLILFPAAGYGWLVAEAMGRVTNRRRGPGLQAAAVASCILVYLVHNVVAPPHVLVPQNDVIGYIFVGLAAFIAVGYLR